MADQVDGDEGGSLTYEQSLAADRAAFLGGDEGDGDGDTGGDEKPVGKSKAKPGKSKAPKVEPDEDEDDVDDDQDDDSDLDEDDETVDKDLDEDDDEEDEDDDDQDDDSDLDDDEEPDADTAKRLAKVRKNEQRSRAAIQAERAKFERERDAAIAEWKPKIEAAQKFEALKASGGVRYKAVEILRELGATDADLELIAHDVYAHSPKGAEDPKRRAAVAQSKREHEQAERIAKLEAEAEARKETESKREQQTYAEREAERYLDKVSKATSEKTPLAKQYLAKNPEKARNDLAAIASRLAEETGSVPDPRAVMRAFEKDRRRILRDLGIDPKALQKTTTLKGDTKKATAKKIAKLDKKVESSKALTFEEQRARDREAFMNGNDDDEDDN